MKNLKEILTEGVFDKDLVEKDPIDWSWFIIKNPNDRYDLFIETFTMLFDPENHWPDWTIEKYKEHQSGFDYIIRSLHDAFKKQHFDSWINITSDDFEEMGDEMTEEEIDHYNNELHEYFAKATETETGGLFVMGKGKLPDFILNIIEGTGNPVQKFAGIKQWAIDYYQDGSTQQMIIYGCPKDLDLTVKKILYD